MARKGQGIEIVEGWTDGLGGEDFLRGLVQRTVEQVLEAEMTSFLGAGSYERTGDQRTLFQSCAQGRIGDGRPCQWRRTSR